MSAKSKANTKKLKQDKVLQILVMDSFHTRMITENLSKHFGRKAACHANEAPKRTKIDVFFLSGMNILDDGPQALQDLRHNLGSKDCKVIAVSTLPENLEEISRRAEFKISGTISKGKIVPGLSCWEREDLSTILKKILGS